MNWQRFFKISSFNTDTYNKNQILNVNNNNHSFANIRNIFLKIPILIPHFLLKRKLIVLVYLRFSQVYIQFLQKYLQPGNTSGGNLVFFLILLFLKYLPFKRRKIFLKKSVTFKFFERNDAVASRDQNENLQKVGRTIKLQDITY